MLFEASNVNGPKSPCADSAPAQGALPCLAINLATLVDVFVPVASGLVTISTAGLSRFSKTFQL